MVFEQMCDRVRVVLLEGLPGRSGGKDAGKESQTVSKATVVVQERGLEA